MRVVKAQHQLASHFHIEHTFAGACFVNLQKSVQNKNWILFFNTTFMRTSPESALSTSIATSSVEGAQMNFHPKRAGNFSTDSRDTFIGKMSNNRQQEPLQNNLCISSRRNTDGSVSELFRGQERSSQRVVQTFSVFVLAFDADSAVLNWNTRQRHKLLQLVRARIRRNENLGKES